MRIHCRVITVIMVFMSFPSFDNLSVWNILSMLTKAFFLFIFYIRKIFAWQSNCLLLNAHKSYKKSFSLLIFLSAKMQNTNVEKGLGIKLTCATAWISKFYLLSVLNFVQLWRVSGLLKISNLTSCWYIIVRFAIGDHAHLCNWAPCNFNVSLFSISSWKRNDLQMREIATSIYPFSEFD